MKFSVSLSALFTLLLCAALIPFAQAQRSPSRLPPTEAAVEKSAPDKPIAEMTEDEFQEAIRIAIRNYLASGAWHGLDVPGILSRFNPLPVHDRLYQQTQTADLTGDWYGLTVCDSTLYSVQATLRLVEEKLVVSATWKNIHGDRTPPRFRNSNTTPTSDDEVGFPYLLGYERNPKNGWAVVNTTIDDKLIIHRYGSSRQNRGKTERDHSKRLDICLDIVLTKDKKANKANIKALKKIAKSKAAPPPAADGFQYKSAVQAAYDQQVATAWNSLFHKLAATPYYDERNRIFLNRWMLIHAPRSADISILQAQDDAEAKAKANAKELNAFLNLLSYNPDNLYTIANRTHVHGHRSIVRNAIGKNIFADEEITGIIDEYATQIVRTRYLGQLEDRLASRRAPYPEDSVLQLNYMERDFLKTIRDVLPPEMAKEARQLIEDKRQDVRNDWAGRAMAARAVQRRKTFIALGGAEQDWIDAPFSPLVRDLTKDRKKGMLSAAMELGSPKSMIIHNAAYSDIRRMARCAVVYKQRAVDARSKNPSSKEVEALNAKAIEFVIQPLFTLNKIWYYTKGYRFEQPLQEMEAQLRAHLTKTETGYRAKSSPGAGFEAGCQSLLESNNLQFSDEVPVILAGWLEKSSRKMLDFYLGGD